MAGLSVLSLVDYDSIQTILLHKIGKKSKQTLLHWFQLRIRLIWFKKKTSLSITHKMVTERSWSSFHQKFGSERSRRSSKIKDSGDDSDGRFSGAVHTLLRKGSSRKSMIPDEYVRNPLSRSSSSSDSSIRSSRNLMLPDEIKRKSLSRSESVSLTDSAITSSRNLMVQDEIKRKHLSRSRSLYAYMMVPEERPPLSRSRSSSNGSIDLVLNYLNHVIPSHRSNLRLEE